MEGEQYFFFPVKPEELHLHVTRSVPFSSSDGFADIQ